MGPDYDYDTDDDLFSELQDKMGDVDMGKMQQENPPAAGGAGTTINIHLNTGGMGAQGDHTDAEQGGVSRRPGMLPNSAELESMMKKAGA